MTPGVSLQWGPKEVEDLRERVKYLEGIIAERDGSLDSVGELVGHLKRAIQGAPCLVARPGEATYECRHDSPCRVCQWRQGVSRELAEEWGMQDGIWWNGANPG